ncbi:flippase [Thalassotalea psychrophila]|uniref:Flippase n=1 Tax=Thalassotalea psychrophila TaxID=3065647 RepID=A0ABY9TU15_9GAMM|nr:flippase [Colwelliaceae bacterium SQ149]
MKYLTNTSWLFVEKIIRLSVGLFIGVWLARYLGPEQFGLFSYAQSFVALFAAIATLGLDNIVIRELVKDSKLRDQLLGTAFFLKCFGALLLLLLISVSILFSSNTSYTNHLIFIIALAVVFQSFNVIDFYFQSKVRSKFVAFANFYCLLISSFVKIYLIVNQWPLIAFAYVLLFDSFIFACGLIYFYKGQGLSYCDWYFDKKLAKSLIKKSWPLILSGIVISIYMKVDQIMLKHMLDEFAVGQYAAAVRLSEAWYFISAVLCSSLYPAIINAKETSSSLYTSRLLSFYKIMIWIAITIAIPVTFTGDFIVNVLYGEQYNAASSVLIIHIWTAVFAFLGGASNHWLITENLQKYALINTILGAVFNILLNYYLIPIWGIEGAAWSTLISYCIAAYLSLMLFKATRSNFVLLTKAFLLRKA